MHILCFPPFGPWLTVFFAGGANGPSIKVHLRCQHLQEACLDSLSCSPQIYQYPKLGVASLSQQLCCITYYFLLYHIHTELAHLLFSLSRSLFFKTIIHLILTPFGSLLSCHLLTQAFPDHPIWLRSSRALFTLYLSALLCIFPLHLPHLIKFVCFWLSFMPTWTPYSQGLSPVSGVSPGAWHVRDAQKLFAEQGNFHHQTTL